MPILTIEEALTAIKRDSDIDNEVQSLLEGIDEIAYEGTGVRWQELEPIPAIAKMWARLYLQIETGFVSNPMYQEALISRMKQMQLRAMNIDERWLEN